LVARLVATLSDCKKDLDASLDAVERGHLFVMAGRVALGCGPKGMASLGVPFHRHWFQLDRRLCLVMDVREADT
jgi:hypothetical protein